MFILLRALLILAHLFYGLFRTTRLLWLVAKRRYEKLRCADNASTAARNVIECTRGLKKLPAHFALILGSEEPSLIDLAHLITWCVISGIPCVTFYDDKGHLKKNELVIREKISKRIPDLEEYIEWNPRKSSKTIKNGTSGIKHKTRIQLLSYEDGKGEIISLAQNLATAVKMDTLKVEEITMELIDRKLAIDGMPEPDLAVICGQTICTYGFLPWHTRVTEFHSLPTHHDVSVNEFLNILKAYSKCQQRYGK